MGNTDCCVVDLLGFVPLFASSILFVCLFGSY